MKKHSYNWSGIGTMNGEYFSRIKKNALKRKLCFLLTKEEIWDLYIKQNKKCALSGLDIMFEDNSASLDRIDSSKGYTIDNIQWVHKDVNMMKNKLNEQTFINYCFMIINKEK